MMRIKSLLSGRIDSHLGNLSWSEETRISPRRVAS
jgi:hypothetical protein